MNYISEKKALKSLLSDEVLELLKDAEAVIAGGAITSLFTNREVNDLDVYFRSEEQLFRTIAAIYGLDDYTDYVEIGQFELVYNGHSQRTLMFQNGEQDVQFMTFKWFDSINAIFETFDFTCCMGAYDCSTDEFVLHPEFMQHNSQRYLKFNPGTAYPIMSLMRVDKYRERGYVISKTEMLRVIGTCMALDIKSWGDVKDHIGGMYGYDVDDVFDETVEFSIDEMVNQLDTINESDIRKFNYDSVTKRDFWDAVKVFCHVPEPDGEEERIVFDDEKYLYKCVNENYESPLAPANKRIRYKEGDVISTKDHGPLYFNRSHTDLFHETKYWVEAELVYGSVPDSDFYAGKRVLDGVVRINRCFEYHSSGVDYKQEYLSRKYKLGVGS